MQTKYSDLDIHFQFEEYIVNAIYIVYERFTRTIPSHSHGHDCYEIHYIPNGYGKLEADGRFYEIGPNTIYVTGPMVKHAQTPLLSDPMQEYCIYLKVHRLQRKGNNSPLMDKFMQNAFWFGKDNQAIPSLVKQLFDELQHRRSGYLKEVELLLSHLIISLVRDYEHSKPVQNQVLSHNFNDSKSVVIEEYFLYEYNDLSLEGLANRLMLSARQTQRLLREFYGKTFQQKKAEARMSAAAILLSEKTQSITSISNSLGYSSPEHFSTDFRKHYGISPREFRNKY